MKKILMCMHVIMMLIMTGRLVADQKRYDTGFAQKKLRIGDYAHGGVVFYLTLDGLHGLVVATEDVAGTFQWSPLGAENNVTNSNDLDSLPLYAGEEYPGQKNTTAILNYYAANDNPYAAKAAATYSITIDGVTYDDWFLPATSELNLIYGMRDLLNVVFSEHGGNQLSSARWSSNQPSTLSAHIGNFHNDSYFFGTNTVKNIYLKVRPIRAF